MIPDPRAHGDEVERVATDAEVVADLMRAKALFQQRTIAAIIRGPAHLSQPAKIEGDAGVSDFQKVVDEAMARYRAMTPEAQAQMKADQRASYIRGMTTPCEHGVLDFEQCPDCRGAAK